jgi:hypothetical protein
MEFGELMDLSDDQVAGQVRAHVRGRASGAGVIWDFWHVATLRDGKVRRLEWFADRDEAFAAVRVRD